MSDCIQEHLDDDEDQEADRTADSSTQSTAGTPRKRNFSEITPPERKLKFIVPNFNDLESQSVSTPVTNKTSSKPRTVTTKQV